MSELFGFLYARPSAVEGAARLVDWGGTLNEYNRSLTPQMADELALFADWWTVGEDVGIAVNEYAQGEHAEAV